MDLQEVLTEIIKLISAFDEDEKMRLIKTLAVFFDVELKQS